NVVPRRRWHGARMVPGMVCAPHRLPTRQGGAVDRHGDGGSGQAGDPPGGLEGSGFVAAAQRAERNAVMVRLHTNGKKLRQAMRYVIAMAVLFSVLAVGYVSWSLYLR